MRRTFTAAAGLTLALAMMPSCVLVAESGTMVEIGLRVEQGSAVSADGLAVSMIEAQLSLEDAWLLPCEEGAGAGALSLFHPAVARALHGNPDGERIGEPHVVSLLEPDTVLGAVQPGAGRFCALQVVMTPSPALDGWALRVRALAGSEPIEAEGYAMRLWRVPLSEPLELSDTHRLATVELVLHPGRAVEQVALRGRDADAVGLDLLLALEAGAEAEVR